MTSAQTGCESDDKAYMPFVALAAAHIARRETTKAVNARKQCYPAKPDLSKIEIESLIGSNLGKAFIALEAGKA